MPSAAERSCYIAGPMSGKPGHGYPAFEDAARALRHEGWIVLSPHTDAPPVHLIELEERRTGLPFNQTPLYAALMRRDLQWVLQVGTVFLLPGWRESNGAWTEALVAWITGKDVIDFTTREPVPPVRPAEVLSSLVQS